MNIVPFVSRIKATVRIPRHNCFECKNECLMNCPVCVGIKATVRCSRHNCFEFKRKSHELSLCVGIKATVRCLWHNCFEFESKVSWIVPLCRNPSNCSCQRHNCFEFDTKVSWIGPFCVWIKATVRYPKTQLLRVWTKVSWIVPVVSESKQQFVARDTTNCFEFKRKFHELSLCVGIKATVRCPRHNCFEFKRKSHAFVPLCRNPSNSSLLETELLRV